MSEPGNQVCYCGDILSHHGPYTSHAFSEMGEQDPPTEMYRLDCSICGQPTDTYSWDPEHEEVHAACYETEMAKINRYHEERS